MAEIRPLRAWRYNKKLSENIEALTSPLFDVVSHAHREALYANPYNSIHLSVPQTTAPADHARNLLDVWKKEGVIVQDAQPGIYVYYQYFTPPGASKEICRKGFVCNIHVHDWNEGVIQRHENTIPTSVNDRTELLEKTQLNVSATHGLYTDYEFVLEEFMDAAIENPLYETEDYQGVRDVLAVITDNSVIQKFISVLTDKKVILADGHHRYEGSLLYKKQQQKLNPNHTNDEAYNFHLMYLTNTETGGYRILPTHRLIKDLKTFDEKEFVQKLSEDFTVSGVDDKAALPEIISGKSWTFGVLLKNSAFKVQLKAESFPQLKWNFPSVVKQLDLTVLHYFIIEKILNIPGREQRQSPNIEFDRNFSNCLSIVVQEKAQVAIITNEISIEEVKNVCESGYTMPQKSTYFYPKVICGLMFSSIQQDEFN